MHHQVIKPHVLILLEDDGGYNGVGYMNERLFPGAPKLHTPVLDALAAEAVKLTAFYVQVRCNILMKWVGFGQTPSASSWFWFFGFGGNLGCFPFVPS